MKGIPWDEMPKRLHGLAYRIFNDFRDKEPEKISHSDYLDSLHIKAENQQIWLIFEDFPKRNIAGVVVVPYYVHCFDFDSYVRDSYCLRCYETFDASSRIVRYARGYKCDVTELGYDPGCAPKVHPSVRNKVIDEVYIALRDIAKARHINIRRRH